MSELGFSLTVVGIVATVISLLFAAASLYVSHRQRHGGSHHPKNDHAKNSAPHTNVTPHSSNEPPPSMAAAASATPYFRKLGVHGLEETAVSERQADSAYIWE